jgi:hypothetical protein
MASEFFADEVAAISFWLAPENAQARRELERRHPELGGWLQMVEKRVAEAEGQIIMTSESNANRKFK